MKESRATHIVRRLRTDACLASRASGRGIDVDLSLCYVNRQMAGRNFLAGAVATILTACALTACASSRAPAGEGEPKLYVNGVRQKPVTVEEITHEVERHGDEFSRCYGRERLNLAGGNLSDYVFRVRVANDGSKPEVKMNEASTSGQATLEACLEQILGSMRFPPHIGGAVTVNVPIKAPR